MICKPQITRSQLQTAFERWMQFWDLPPELRNRSQQSLRTWLDRYREAVNTSIVVRQYWEEACIKVMATCRWFPWPKDVIEAARLVDKEDDCAFERQAPNEHRNRKITTEKAATDQDVQAILSNLKSSFGSKQTETKKEAIERPEQKCHKKL